MRSTAVYLPLIRKPINLYFEGPWEQEDNDNVEQANGYLRLGKTYYGFPDDAKDFFSIHLDQPSTISIDLQNYNSVGQLQLFYQSTANRVAWDVDPPYHLSYAGLTGTYYIYIATVSGFSSTTPYNLAASHYYFEGPWEQEDNNSAEQANGRLRSHQPYYGYPNDAKDYFFIQLEQPGRITVDLQEYHNIGQLQLFYQSTNNRVALDTEPPYRLDYQNAPAGIYYIYIFTASGFNTTTPYTLVAEY